MNANYWADDENLKHDLQEYVLNNFKRTEVLDFMRKEYPEYTWSLDGRLRTETLDGRLRYFNISYIDYQMDVDTVRAVVQNEVCGPGQLLGYRAMNQKRRCEHGIKVPCSLVYNVMMEMDPEGQAQRSLIKKRKRRANLFSTDGPLYVVSLDGHDKLCGYQNWTFPLGLYGCIDSFSRKMLFLYVCQSNSSSHIIARRYFDFLYDTRVLPKFLRIDKGSETGKMTTLHAYLTSKLSVMEDPTDSVIYGPSNTNKIERW